jgi:predicted lipoprotein with Yx(FWY)xxD motif
MKNLNLIATWGTNDASNCWVIDTAEGWVVARHLGDGKWKRISQGDGTWAWSTRGMAEYYLEKWAMEIRQGGFWTRK